ncbi:MAG: Asp/Glu racemase [Pseudomonadota bacterium]
MVPRLGLIALQSDESIERDMRRLVPMDVDLMVSRVRSGENVSSDSLSAMEADLATAAGLFPRGVVFDALAYGCTSGTAQIGADRVASQIRRGTEARHVTQPLSALIAGCRHLGIRRLALLSPYVAPVSSRLQQVIASSGIETPVFGSFNVCQEATVVRITPESVCEAAASLMEGAEVDGLFLSCTNLRVLDVIEPLEAQLGKPVLTSNQVLAWQMLELAGVAASLSAPGQLFSRHRSPSVAAQ